MSRWQAEIIARPKHFRCLIRASVIFEAEDNDAAKEQAEAYADRLGMYDAADVDALFEIAPPGGGS